MDSNRFKNIQRDEFNKFAEFASLSNSNNRALEFEYAKILSKMQDKISESVVLDLGCGAGRYSMEIAKKAKEVIGIDISDKSIETANKIAKQKNIDNFKGIVGDFKNITYSNYFDYVLAVNVLHHTKDKKLIFQNIKQALKRGGKLIIFEFNPLNPLFIPFLILIGQTRSHLNTEYWRSNIFSLREEIRSSDLKIESIEKYAFLPTLLYNISMFFETANRFLNRIPFINTFNAFNIIICSKSDK